jgi:hypothetical protein
VAAAFVVIFLVGTFGITGFSGASALAGLAFTLGLLGAGVPLTIGHLYARGWFKWRLRVKDGYGAKVRVEAWRMWETVELAEIKTSHEDFDERLHAAIASARVKVAAMNQHRGLFGR